MARIAKKEKALTLEEKLKQALVPEAEQPYQVPENWIYCRIEGIATRIKRGKTPKYVSESNILVFAQKCNQKDGTIALEKAQFLDAEMLNKVSSDEFLQDYDIIINSTGAGTLGRIGLYRNVYAAPYSLVLPDSHITVVRTTNVVNKTYLYLLLKSKQDYLEAQGVGSTNQKELRPESIGNILLPLPPLAEQQRIVERIESLFAKLDEAKEKAQAVIDGFEDRKAAILHKAFTGELTERWRKNQARLLTTWKKVVIQDECEKITCGNTPTEFISTSGEIPFLKVYNIVDNKVDFESKPQFIPESVHKERLSSSILLPNDVIMNIVGPPLRKIAIVPNTFPEWNMNQAIVRFRPKKALNYRFLYYSLLNPETLDDVINATRGVVGQANISISQSRNLKIVLPLLDEQMEIVRVLEELLTQEQEAKENALQVIEYIDMIKKSVLSRAFRGELGTNDPTDERAVELLKSIL